MTTSKPPLPRRSALLLLACVGASLGLVGALAGHAAAADSTNYGIRPAESADHLRMELAPGAATRQTVMVSDDVDMARLVLPVIFVVASLSVPAVTVPVVILRLPTAMVRAVVSVVPAALVGVVAETLTAQAAPVPRASVIDHGDVAEAAAVVCVVH